MIYVITHWLAPVRQRRAVAFPGLVLAAVIGILIAMVVVGSCTCANGQEVDTQRAALVHVGDGGSGVCVSADGWILTAAHCVAKETPGKPDWRGRPTPATVEIPTVVKVRFPNQETRSAKVACVWRPERKTDLALLKVDVRGGLPWIPYAQASPGIGEEVTSIGYPAGHFARFESDVTFVGVTNTSFGPMDLIQTSHRGNPGHSGGPLLNRKGEVCGICSMGSVDFLENGRIKNSPQVSLWARCEYFPQLFQEVGAKPVQRLENAPATRLIVDVWWSSSCEPCHKMYADAESLRINYKGERIDKYVDVVAHNFDQNRAEAQQAGITHLPTLIVRNTGERIIGYEGPATLNAVLVRLLAQPSNDAPRYEPPPPDADEPLPVARAPRPKSFVQPVPEQTEEDIEPKPVDATGVTVLVLVRNTSIGNLFPSGATLVDKFAENSLSKRLNKAFSNKANIEFVFQRTMPTRFDAVVESQALTVKRNAVFVVLIPKKFTGVVGQVVSTIEGVLQPLTDGDWKLCQIQTVIERKDAVGYQQAIEASQTSESAIADNGDSPASGNWLLAYLGAFAASVHKQFFPNKQATATA